LTRRVYTWAAQPATRSLTVADLRAVGRTREEAFALYQRFRRLEEAGAVLVEAEVIPGPVMAEISARSGLITVSLGSGTGADVMYLFMEDICGEKETAPRHARAFGNLARLYTQIQEERISALKGFRAASMDGTLPADGETAEIAPHELVRFLERLES